MRNNFRLFVFIFFFSLFQLLPKINAATTELPFPNPDITISMDFQDVSIKDILKIFSIQTGLNFIASEAVQERKVTLYLDKVPMKLAMDKLFKANNLSYEMDKAANIFIVKDWGKPQIETITKIYRLKYQSVPSANIAREKTAIAQGGGTTGGAAADLIICIKQLLSRDGKISEDPYTNSLIITDVPTSFAAIEQLIAKLDVPQVQVMLEIEMLDVNKKKMDKIGLKYGDTPIVLKATLGSFDTNLLLPKSLLKHHYTDTTGVTSGNIDLSTVPYSVQLDFIRTLTDSKTLARPKILTLNNETAEIKITTKKSLNTTTTQATETATSTAGIERQEVGVTLRVTPQVNPDTGEITMVILPKVSDVIPGITVSGTSTTAGYTAQDPDERSTKSVIRVKDGDTVVLAGLIRTDVSQTITKLPFFGDLPLIGAMFRHKYKDKDDQRELIVFITPHIIKDGSTKVAQEKKVTLPEREQNTASGISRHGIIEASLNSFDRKR